MSRGRPPRTIGVAGTPNLVLLKPGHWRAEVYVRDATGRRRPVSRVSPKRVDSRGRRLPDRDGSYAAERVLAAAAQLSPRLEASLSSSTKIRRLWELYREYLVRQNRAGGTMRLYDRWAQMFVKAYGDRQLIEVPTETVEAFLTAVGDGHGRGSMLNARSMLSGMFRYAVRKNALAANPVREADVPKDVAPQGRTGGARDVTVEELRFILAAVRGSQLPCPRKLTRKERERGKPVKSYTPPTVAEYCEEADLADLVTLAPAVGKRPSQLLGLLWTDIDLEAKTLRTVGKVVRVTGVGLVRQVIADDPKNRGGIVALPEFAVAMLRRRRKALVERMLVSGPTGNGTGEDIVFPSQKWGWRDPTNVQHEWQRVREALGLPDDVTLYSSRKALATIADDAGLSARIIADVLEHADPAMTQRRYMARGRVHHVVADVLDAALGESA